MQFKRQIRWGGVLKAAGLITLGYFVGRPDQLERLARSLSSLTAGQPRYVVPATVQTVPLVYQQPVTTSTITLPPQAQAWSRFSSAQGRFSVLLPSAPTESADANGKHFSVQIGEENYSVSYNDQVPNIHLLTTEGKQAVLNRMPKELKLDDLTVIGHRSFGLNGNPGVEIHLRHNSSNLPNGIMRYMIVGNRMYGLGVASSDPQKTQLFLDSFQAN